MHRLSKDNLKTITSNKGEVDCLLWKKIKFSWDCNINNVDQYVAEGFFVLVPGKYVYENLTISADFQNNVFYLKTGYGKPITCINILDL